MEKKKKEYLFLAILSSSICVFLLIYFFNLIKMAIASKMSNIPMTINKIFSILANPKFDSGKLVTVVESFGLVTLFVGLVVLVVFVVFSDDVFVELDVLLESLVELVSVVLFVVLVLVLLD